MAIRKGGASKIFADGVTFNKATGRAITMSQKSLIRDIVRKVPLLLSTASTVQLLLPPADGLGFNGSDLDAVVDLGSQVDVKNVAVRTLVDHPNWILDAESIEVGVSEERKKYTTMATEEIFSRPSECTFGDTHS